MYRPMNITQYLRFLPSTRLCQFQRKRMSLLFSREPWENTEKAYFQVDPQVGWVTLHWRTVTNMRRVRFNSYSNMLAEGWTGIDSLHLLWLSLGHWEPNTFSLPPFTLSGLPKVCGYFSHFWKFRWKVLYVQSITYKKDGDSLSGSRRKCFCLTLKQVLGQCIYRLIHSFGHSS